MELAPKLSNHIMATGPKLEGNTLHNKASFLECTAILWLKWLTYSTGVRSTIVHSQRWLIEPLRKSSFLNPEREGGPRNLVEHPAHHIISLAFGGWVLVSALVVVVLIIRERLTRGSPWSRYVTTVEGKILMSPNRIWGSQTETRRWALEIKPKGYWCGVSPLKWEIEAAP